MANLNLYASLTTIKRRLGITGTADDTDLTMLLEASSRQIDDYCERWFYAETATKYFDGSASPFFLPYDLLSVSTFKLDEDGDATFESSLVAADYHLYPLAKYPKTWIRVSANGNYGGFASGIRKGIELAGIWGYGDGISATPYSLSTTTTNEEMDASETGMDVVSSTPFAVGMTILVESEQMFISAVGTNTLTVTRGVNGTTAATHAISQTVYIYEYPKLVAEATLMQATRWFKRKDSAYATVVATPELGQFEVYRGLDPDIKLMLKKYVRLEC